MSPTTPTPKTAFHRRHAKKVVLGVFIVALLIVGFIIIRSHAAQAPSPSRFPGSEATLVVGKDPTTANFTDIQSALNALPASGGKLFLQSGMYQVSSTLTIPNSKIAIEGEGNSTLISCAVGSGTACLKPAKTGLSQITLRDFELLQAANSGQGIGLDTSDTSNVVVDGVRLDGFGTGLSLLDHTSTTFYSAFRNLQIYNCRNGISVGGTQANNNVFENIRIAPRTGAGGVGVSLVDTRGLTFTNLDVEPGAGASAGMTGVLIDATSRELVFINPWIENNQTGVTIHPGATRVSFIGGSLTSNTTDLIDQGTSSSFTNTNLTGKTLNYGPPNQKP